MIKRLQQEPSEILLTAGSTQLVIEERTRIKWIVGMVGLWAVLGGGIASALVVGGGSKWLGVCIFGLAVGMVIMTLLSWVVTQTCTFDTATNTVTCSQTGLWGPARDERCSIDEMERIELVPKTGRKAWSYYISLQLTSGKRVEIDLTSSEAVDREVVRSIERFLNFPLERCLRADTDPIRRAR